MIQNMQIEDLNVRASLYAIFHKTCQIETNNRSDIRPFCILYPAGHLTPHSRYPAGYFIKISGHQIQYPAFTGYEFDHLTDIRHSPKAVYPANLMAGLSLTKTEEFVYCKVESKADYLLCGGEEGESFLKLESRWTRSSALLESPPPDATTKLKICMMIGDER